MYDLVPMIVDRITAHDAERPRSLQVDVGPSDLGDPCDHCLAAKFAGWERRRELAWLPYIGTAVHAQLALAFEDHSDWAVEVPILAGRVNGRDVLGTADLWHRPSRTVVDFKVVGVNTLRAAKRGDISEKYRRQVHLYGRGFEAEHVAIMFLPRSAPNLTQSLVYWQEPFDEGIAYTTLNRAERIAFAVSNRTGQAQREYISASARAKDCFDCPRYDDWAAHCASLWKPEQSKTVMSSIMD